MDVLVAANAMWGNVVNYADKRGVDTAAAQALTAAVYVAIEKLAGRGEVWEGQ